MARPPFFVLHPSAFILRFTAPPRFERGSTGSGPAMLPVTPQGIHLSARCRNRTCDPTLARSRDATSPIARALSLRFTFSMS